MCYSKEETGTTNWKRRYKKNQLMNKTQRSTQQSDYKCCVQKMEKINFLLY